MRKTPLTAAATLALSAATLALSAAAAPAQGATGCLFNPADSADGDVAYIRGPTDLVLLTNLRVSGSMNCSSARYVVNNWFKPQYRRRGYVRLSFYDGYVTWQCANLPGRTYRCHESQSGTSFRFNYRRL